MNSQRTSCGIIVLLCLCNRYHLFVIRCPIEMHVRICYLPVSTQPICAVQIRDALYNVAGIEIAVLCMS